MYQNIIASSDVVNSTTLAQKSQEQNQNSRVDTITSLELVKQINFFRSQESGKANLEHKNLLEVIRDEFEQEISQLKIQPSEYKSDRGQIYPMFILTFEQAKQVLVRESKVVRKAIFKYISELQNKLKQVANEKDSLYVKLFSKDIMEVVNAHKSLMELEIKPLLEKIENDKPFTELGSSIASSTNTVLICEFVKLFPPQWNLEEFNFYKLLRNKKVLLGERTSNGYRSKDWDLPVQEELLAGRFEIKETTYINPYTQKQQTKLITMITGKGQAWLSSKLKTWGYE